MSLTAPPRTSQRGTVRLLGNVGGPTEKPQNRPVSQFRTDETLPKIKRRGPREDSTGAIRPVPEVVD
jgi:hypothetical protein